MDQQIAPVTWLTVAFSAISMIGATATAIIAAVVKIAQIRADVKTARLEEENVVQATQIATLTAQHRTCEENTAQTQQKLEECEKKHESNEARITRLEEIVSPKK